MQSHEAQSEAEPATFATDPTGLSPAGSPATVDVEPGQSFDLRIHPVAKSIGRDNVRMLSYNGSVPGPTLRVRQGSEVAINVVNDGDIEATVHWHGLRLENRYDGVPHQTQAPIPVGGTYTHHLSFPDAGVFWYHPHIREDFAQEMGLYGNVVVVPSDPQYWPAADLEVVYTLDDILIEDGRIAAFSRQHSDHTAMGRYGNVLLIDGETEQHLAVRRNEVVRFCLTNTANTRVFKVALPGLSMKLVGADGGRYEREELVDSVIISPSERAIVDVLFDRAGEFVLSHVTPGRSSPLANIRVDEGAVDSPAAAQFANLRTNAEMVAERQRIAPYLEAPPDKTLALVAEMDSEEPSAGPVTYSCPMHPEVTSDQPGSCPKCGMKLMPVGRVPAATGTDHGSHVEAHGSAHAHAHAHGHGASAGEESDLSGIEWEDLMVEVNRLTTPQNMRWKIIDRDTGKENADIDWRFRQGDQVKIRLINEMDSDHPMHHPFHIHGERFLVLSRGGVAEPNLVWKDTVLVTTGQTVDILMDGSNPGLWMAHCHIAEHNEAGMMFSFRVDKVPQK